MSSRKLPAVKWHRTNPLNKHRSSVIHLKSQSNTHRISIIIKRNREKYSNLLSLWLVLFGFVGDLWSKHTYVTFNRYRNVIMKILLGVVFQNNIPCSFVVYLFARCHLFLLLAVDIVVVINIERITNLNGIETHRWNIHLSLSLIRDR